MWKKSGLTKGERIRIPEEFLVSGNNKHFIKAEYEGEARSGIILRLYFEAGFLSSEPTWSYRYFVDWKSIYCGHVKLKTVIGEDIKAVYITERRAKNGKRRG